MSVAEKLERMARWIPGIAGYQDRESARETDRVLRLRIVDELLESKARVEAVKRDMVREKRLAPLAELDRLTATLDMAANTVRYAARGYRGWFDAFKVTRRTLDQLYAFDLSLIDDVKLIARHTRSLQEGERDTPAMSDAMRNVERAMDRFATHQSRRSLLMTKRG